MALGILDKDTRRKVFLSISHGKVVHYLPGGEAENFKNVGGKLQDIYLKERSFQGKDIPFWYVDMRDGADYYSLSFPYSSGTFKSVILSLASCKNLSKETTILIEPYEKNEYTKVVVYADGEKLDWVVKELPPLDDVVLGGRNYQDDTKRMNFIKELASQVKTKIGKGRLS